MFHPVGSQPPSVYWRRRFLLLATVVIVVLLLVLTVRAATSGADGSPQASGAGGSGPTTSAGGLSSSPAPHSSSAARSRSRSRTSSPQSSSSAAGRRHRGGGSDPSTMSVTSRRRHSASSSSSAPPPRCAADQLTVRAYVPQTQYHVGDKPEVALQVTDTGSAPCVQDLADSQVVLQVYNGESRVWGSHDCQIEPGTDDRVLPVGQPVRVSVTWSGYTSTPGCKGTRQRVGVGTYTLYAALSGHQGAAAQFSIV